MGAAAKAARGALAGIRVSFKGKEASEALTGLSEAISEQFDGWSLTPAERRVAIGLLKGLSHKGIARQAGGSERTIRQHSVAIYRKSGLGGRAALAGFFLEALLLPEDIALSADAGAP